MTMLRAGGLLDVLTPLSDCRHETVEKIMERRISGLSCMCWMDFHDAILCCGFLCARLMSLYFVSSTLCLSSLSFTATTPRAITPHLYHTGYHAQGYHALTTTVRLSRPCMHPGYHAIVYFYSFVITPELSRSTTLVHRVITPAIVVRILLLTFHRLLCHLFFSTYTTTGRHTYQPTPQSDSRFRFRAVPESWI